MLAWLRRIHQKLGIKYRFDRCRRWVARFGARNALSTYRRIRRQEAGMQSVLVPGIPRPVTLRAGTADVSTLEKIFVWNGYDLEYPDSVRTVVDAGANIGLSSIFFATRFSDATVIAIEPNDENFRLLLQNTAAYPRVVPIRAALWNEVTTIGLSNPADRVDSYRYSRAASNDAVETVTIDALLARFGIPHIDLLKIDIEGAETEVFAGNPEWVRRVGMFVIELHGDQARTCFGEATRSLDAVRYPHGEDMVVRVR